MSKRFRQNAETSEQNARASIHSFCDAETNESGHSLHDDDIRVFPFLSEVREGRDSLPEAVVETGEQMRDVFSGFVAHVGEAEGLTFDFAVTAVDDQVMFFAKISH